jgi:PEGA domain
MKRALLLGIAAAAMLLPSVPASGEPSPSGSVVTASRRGHGRYYRRPSFYWGWGGYWGPYGYYGSPYYYGYRGGYYGRPYGYAPSSDWAAVDTDVSPEGAYVYLDGTYVGTADDFDGFPDYLYLKRGNYRLEFRLPGYETKSIQVQARPGVKLSIDDGLHKIAGAKQYGSYDEPAQLEGGVRRFWGKRKDVAEAIDDEEQIYGRRPDRDADAYRDDDAERSEDEEQAEERAEEEREAETDLPRESSGVRSEEWRKARPESPKADSGETARLRIAIEPSDAVVFLDDRFIGTAQEIASLPRGISVAAGKHTVTVSRPGYKDRTVEITVAAGETEEVDVELKR